MIQNTFVDPTTTVPVPGGANVGNGSMSTPVVSSATLTENFTVSCVIPGGANVGQFSVTGSVSGLIGTATSDVEFIDAQKKVRFTLTAGAIPWAVGDQFTYSTTAGAPMSESNIDTYSDPIAAKNEANTFTDVQTVRINLPRQIDIVNPTNAIGTGAGIRLKTGSGWEVGIITRQDQYWVAIEDSTGTPFVAWGGAKQTLGIVPLARLSAADANAGYPQSGTGGETLRIIRGLINGPDGAIVAGTGFTASRTAVGLYTITFSTAFSAAPTTVLTIRQVGGLLSRNEAPGSTGITTFDLSGTAMDRSFSFVTIGPA